MLCCETNLVRSYEAPEVAYFSFCYYLSLQPSSSCVLNFVVDTLYFKANCASPYSCVVTNRDSELGLFLGQAESFHWYYFKSVFSCARHCLAH